MSVPEQMSGSLGVSAARARVALKAFMASILKGYRYRYCYRYA